MKGGIKPRALSKALRTEARKIIRQRIRPLSKRQVKRVNEYARVKKEFLVWQWCACQLRKDPRTKAPICDATFMHLATEIHHSRGRAGSLLTDTRYFIGLCSKAHRWVHENPEQARKMALLCVRGEWNKPEPKTNILQTVLFMQNEFKKLFYLPKKFL